MHADAYTAFVECRFKKPHKTMTKFEAYVRWESYAMKLGDGDDHG